MKTEPSRAERPDDHAFRPCVVSFPLALNRRLIARLTNKFLGIAPGPKRADIFRRTELVALERKRLALGIDPEVVRAELWDLEDAIVDRLAAIYPELADAS